MKPILRSATILAAVVAPLCSAPVLAHSVQNASNHAYAAGSAQPHGLSPVWHEYHNWRSRDSYQTRRALHREVEHQQGSHGSSLSQAQAGVSASSTTDVSANARHVRNAGTAKSASTSTSASQGPVYFDYWKHWGQATNRAPATLPRRYGVTQPKSTHKWHFDHWKHWGQTSGTTGPAVSAQSESGQIAGNEFIQPEGANGKHHFDHWKNWGAAGSG